MEARSSSDASPARISVVWQLYGISAGTSERPIKLRRSLVGAWRNAGSGKADWIAVLSLPGARHNKSQETTRSNTRGRAAAINAISFTHKKSGSRGMEGKQKGGEQNGASSFFTVVSFPLLAVGAGDAQNAVDGVGSYGIVGGAGHWGRRCVGNCRKDQIYCV